VFLGTFEHSLDEKGRLILPSAFREQFRAGAFLTESLDGCLSLMTESIFKDQVAEKQQLAKAGRIARNQLRAFAAGSTRVTPDKQGRIPVSLDQRDFAGISKACVINGAITHLEVWSHDRWAELGGEGREALIAGDDTDIHLRLLLGQEKKT